MNSVLLTTEYFGPISSYRAIEQSSAAYIEYHENYQKKSYRNRCRLLSPNGVILLSIPLSSGKNSKCPIQEVTISYQNDWIAEHFQSFLSCYGKSPYYEYYIDGIMSILHQKHTRLIDLNSALLDFMVKKIGLETPIGKTSSYLKDIDILDLRAHTYLNRSKITPPSVSYNQVWSDRYPFEQDLSILDLLFCKGPESILYLEK